MMARVALVIGVSTYGAGLSLLPNAVKDAAAMKTIFESPEIGKFDEVTFLEDPGPLQMQQAIELLFSGRKRDDLVVLFFSGHGLKDNNYRLYFATSLTKKTERGELVRSTAVSASFIHEVMKDSRSRRKVIILDCCFSGAFAEGLSAKDDGSVDIKAQLGGEGCAILTSSSSIQYSFEEKDKELSIYTRYLLEGIETGAADLDQNGFISVDELHEYVQRRVHEESPSMDPKIYALEEGYNIQLLEAVVPDPHLRYQRMVEQCAKSGTISSAGRIMLDRMRVELQISLEEADLIESRMLRPHRDYSRKLQDYETAFKAALQEGFPIQERERITLKGYAKMLSLQPEDVLMIEAKYGEQTEESKRDLPLSNSLHKLPDRTIANSRRIRPLHTVRILLTNIRGARNFLLLKPQIATFITVGCICLYLAHEHRKFNLLSTQAITGNYSDMERLVALVINNQLSSSSEDRKDTPAEVCFQGEDSYILRDSPGGSQSTGIMVAPGESLIIASGPERRSNFSKDYYEIIKQGDLSSGWIPADTIDWDC